MVDVELAYSFRCSCENAKLDTEGNKKEETSKGEEHKRLKTHSAR